MYISQNIDYLTSYIPFYIEFLTFWGCFLGYLIPGGDIRGDPGTQTLRNSFLVVIA
jgi:hypothetical protein